MRKAIYMLRGLDRKRATATSAVKSNCNYVRFETFALNLMDNELLEVVALKTVRFMWLNFNLAVCTVSCVSASSIRHYLLPNTVPKMAHKDRKW